MQAQAATPPDAKLPSSYRQASEYLHETAVATTGLDDFGDGEEYQAGLDALLIALDKSRHRYVSSSFAFPLMMLTGALCSRLHTVAGLKRHPECIHSRIQKPVAILGLPRTATTALYHLLALDDRLQVPERWLIETPMPRPPKHTWHQLPGYQHSVNAIAGLLQVAPEFTQVHQRQADLGDECLDITSQCFNSILWGTLFPVPEYDDWWQSQPHDVEYAYLEKVLQLIGKNDNRRWLLKDPASIRYIPQLMSTFPDLSVIVTHRHPAQVMPSLCKMASFGAQAMLGDHYSLNDVYEREVRLWGSAANSLAAADFSQCPGRVDVSFNAFFEDPMATVHQIYDGLSMALEPETEAVMRKECLNMATHSIKSRPRYFSDFDFNKEQISAAFSDYMDTFDQYL